MWGLQCHQAAPPSSVTKQCHRTVPPSSVTKQCHQGIRSCCKKDSLDCLAAKKNAADEAAGVNTKAKEKTAVRKTACLAAKKEAADEAAGSNAKAKEEAAVRKLACLAAKKDAADEAAGSHAKTKEEAAVRKLAWLQRRMPRMRLMAPMQKKKLLQKRLQTAYPAVQ